MGRTSADTGPGRSSASWPRRAGGVLLLGLVLGVVGAAVRTVAAESPAASARQLIDHYIDAWRDFYPSRAFAYGDVDSAARFENYSAERVEDWLAFNEQVRRRARELHDGDGLDASLMTDLSVLQGQAIDEQANWNTDRYLSAQPQWYAEQVSQALTHLLVREQLTPAARSQAAIRRLRGVTSLCDRARRQLERGNALRTQRAIEVLEGTRGFYAQQLPSLVADWPEADAITRTAEETVAAIAALQAFLERELLPRATDPTALGEHYATKLMRRSLGAYTPERLRDGAGAEIQSVRRLMIEEAVRWRDSLGRPAPDASGDELLALALAAMESDRQDNAAGFLAEFRELTAAAERFVRDRELASVPQPTTLYVALSPAHFSGAAVGGVYPSGPFAPDADTLFYVPSIPDSAPRKRRERASTAPSTPTSIP
jgi:hypothetical protein